ncbi:MAG: ATP-binding protein [Desulfitobacteriaceae bacterium]
MSNSLGTLYNDIGSKAITITKTVANAIDISEYENIVNSRKKTDYFNQMQNYFRQVQINTGVKYVYIEHKISDSKIEYIFDSEKDSFGEKDDLSDPQAHNQKESFHTKVESFQVWGTLVSGYTPLVNKNGNIVGAVGADIVADSFYSELIFRMIIIILYSLTMIFLFCVVIYVTLKQEIKERKTTEKKLLKTTISLRNLLNNAGQGFLSFGDSLLVDEEFSSECQNLCNRQDIVNEKFPVLLYPEDKSQQLFMEELLLEILYEKDNSRRDILFPLLPEEVIINNKYIKLSYKIINDKHKENSEAYMVILTDISEKRLLQNQMREERKTLKMIIRAMTNQDDFVEIIKSYQSFVESEARQLFTDRSSLTINLSEFFRIIHTFKGSFSQLGMVNIDGKLHELETKISHLLNRTDDQTKEDFLNLIDSLHMSGWLEDDLKILKDHLGEHFFSTDRIIKIPESKLLELEGKLQTMLPYLQCQEIIPEIKKLRFKAFRQLLKGYPEYVQNLAVSLEKLVNPLIIEGGEAAVDSNRYLGFTRSLVHIFRNAIDHGLEAPEVRLENGKEEYGTIKCQIEIIGNSISLIITDDGSGIDVKAIREKALAQGFINSEAYKRLPDEEIILLIFRDDLTTKEDVTKLSGRGIGLAATKNELDKIGGKVAIETMLGLGTKFHFILPLKETPNPRLTFKQK